jgi:hypothetical protein
MKWIALVILVLALYFASSGAAFVAMYRTPRMFSARIATRIYSPLEWLAKQSRAFGRAYNGFQQWCYRQFVDDYRKASVQAPKPPPISN